MNLITFILDISKLFLRINLEHGADYLEPHSVSPETLHCRNEKTWTKINNQIADGRAKDPANSKEKELAEKLCRGRNSKSDGCTNARREF
jgi:hypothetical protein